MSNKNNPNIIDNKNNDFNDLITCAHDKLGNINSFDILTCFISLFGAKQIFDSQYISKNTKIKIKYSQLISSMESYESANEYLKYFLSDSLDILINYHYYINNFRNLEIIKLDSTQSLYHGKVYNISNSNKDSLTIIGSSNLTKTGTARNDYLLDGAKPNEVNYVIDDKNKELFEYIDNNVKDYHNSLSSLEDILSKYTKVVELESADDFVDDVLKYVEGEVISLEISKFVDERWKDILNDYQTQTLKSILQNMEDYGGAVLNYDVGLGKTIIGVAVADYYAAKNLYPLVVTPKRLADVWKNYGKETVYSHDIYHTSMTLEQYFKKRGLEFYYNEVSSNVKSFGEVKNESSSVYIIDEAHNYRNDNTQKRKDLLKSIYLNNSSDKEIENYLKKDKTLERDKIVEQERISNKKVLLITATPCNNSLDDVKFLLDILPISKKYDKELYKTYLQKLDLFTTQKKDTDETRTFIRYFFNRINKEKWRYEKGKESYYFPKRANIDNQNKFLLDTSDSICEELIKENAIDTNYFKVINNQRKLIKAKIDEIDSEMLLAERSSSLLKYNFYFSLDSSFKSFLQSVLNKVEIIMAETNLNIDLSKYYAVNGIEKKEMDYANAIYDSEETLEDIFTDANFGTVSNDVEQKENNNLSDKLIANINKNIDKAQKLYSELLELAYQSIIEYDEFKTKNKADYKSDYLLKVIKSPEFDPLEKKIVFVNRRATLNSVFEFLTTKGINCIAIDGNNNLVVSNNGKTYTYSGNKSQAATIAKKLFAPIANESLSVDNKFYYEHNNKNFEVLITTDVFAEGHNIQDATIVINYDLSWNPCFMLQRNGRVDRYRDYINKYSGQDFYKRVYCYNFFMSDRSYYKENSATFIDLYDRLYKKVSEYDILNSVSLCELYNDWAKNKQHIEDKEKQNEEDLKAREELTNKNLIKDELFSKKVNNEESYIYRTQNINYKKNDEFICCDKSIIISKEQGSKDGVLLCFELKNRNNSKIAIRYMYIDESNVHCIDKIPLQKEITLLQDDILKIGNKINYPSLNIQDLQEPKVIEILKKYKSEFVDRILLTNINNKLKQQSEGYEISKICRLYFIVKDREI